MNQKLLLVVMLLVVIVISGCTSRGGFQQNYAVGTEGVEVTFFNYNNDGVYLAGDYLNLNVDVHNLGRHQFPIGRVYVSGYDKKAIFLTSTQQEVPPLEGKSELNPEGESRTLEFGELRPLAVPFGSEYTPTIQASACYEYQTQAFSSACIIPKIQDLNNANCRPTTQNLGTQGAPVAVTSVEERISQNYVQFLITVENVGSGTVVDLDHMDACPYGLDHKTTNRIHIDAGMSGFGAAICENDNIIRLYNGRGTAICKFVLRPGTEYFETQLMITLDYGYLTSTQKQITILNPFFDGNENK